MKEEVITQGLSKLSELIDTSIEKGDIVEEAVSLDEFLYSKDYLDCPKLSNVQYEFVEALSDVYPNCLYTEVVAEWGKGGGKDFVCAVSLCRVIYLLECLRDPAAFYGLKSGSWIDALNVAVNADRANSVFFVQFKDLVNQSPYFRAMQPRIKGGRIIFPKRVRAISGHSEMEGLEGHNVIVAILDEIDAFKTEQEIGNRSRRAKSAKFIYNRMRSSTQSRFPNIGKVACISFPRFYMSFIQQRRIQGLKEEKTFVSAPEGVPTWIANPIRTEEDFADEFKRDPERALMMYKCQPPMARDAYFRYDAFVLSSFGAMKEGNLILLDPNNRRPIREAHGYEPPFMHPRSDSQHFIHVDLAKNRDRAGFCMLSYDSTKIRVELAWGFEAPRGGEIDFDSIVEFIDKIAHMGFWIRKVTYDGWQSVGSLQQLRKKGIEASMLSIKKEQYDTLKDMINSDTVEGYFYELLVNELLGLELIGGKKVDHKEGGSNDVADALAGATWSAVKGMGTEPSIIIFGSDESNEDSEEEMEEGSEEDKASKFMRAVLSDYKIGGV